LLILVSLPAMMRKILFLCRNQMNMVRIVITNTASGLSRNQIQKIDVALDIKADRDEIRLMNAVESQVKHISMPAGQDNANKIPIKVATPLPPLNFNQTGKQCPKKEAKPAI